jgi:NAD/NADP transhydrogenase beta subunit
MVSRVLRRSTSSMNSAVVDAGRMKFAIHLSPVACRPENVLLAEAGVPYEYLRLEDINAEFKEG